MGSSLAIRLPGLPSLLVTELGRWADLIFAVAIFVDFSATDPFYVLTVILVQSRSKRWILVLMTSFLELGFRILL